MSEKSERAAVTAYPMVPNSAASATSSAGSSIASPSTQQAGLNNYNVLKDSSSESTAASATAAVQTPPQYVEVPINAQGYQWAPVPPYSNFPDDSQAKHAIQPTMGKWNIQLSLMQTADLLFFFFGGGFLFFFSYASLAFVLMLTIIGIPMVPPLLRLAWMNFAPYTSPFETTHINFTRSPSIAIGNVIWAVFFGIAFGLLHMLLAVGYAFTIVGIPFAVVHYKLAFRAVTPITEADALYMEVPSESTDLPRNVRSYHMV